MVFVVVAGVVKQREGERGHGEDPLIVRAEKEVPARLGARVPVSRETAAWCIAGYRRRKGIHAQRKPNPGSPLRKVRQPTSSLAQRRRNSRDLAHSTSPVAERATTSLLVSLEHQLRSPA